MGKGCTEEYIEGTIPLSRIVTLDILRKHTSFGLRSLSQLRALDKKNGNTLWAEAIAKEMKEASTAFMKLESG